MICDSRRIVFIAAMKFHDTTMREKIRNAEDAADAKKFGQYANAALLALSALVHVNLNVVHACHVTLQIARSSVALRLGCGA